MYHTPVLALGWSLILILDKFTQWQFLKKISNLPNYYFGNISERAGMAVSCKCGPKSNHIVFEFCFVLDADEYLVRLKGKI